MKTNNKSDLALTILSGTFLVLSIVRISIELYKVSQQKKCGCHQKEPKDGHSS